MTAIDAPRAAVGAVVAVGRIVARARDRFRSGYRWRAHVGAGLLAWMAVAFLPATATAASALELLCPAEPGRVYDASIDVLGETEPGAVVRVERRHNFGSELTPPEVVAEVALDPGRSVFEVAVDLVASKENHLSVTATTVDGASTSVALPVLVQGSRYLAGVILIQVIGPDVVEAVVARQGGSPNDISTEQAPGWFRVRVPEGTEVEAVASYRTDVDVVSAELALVVPPAPVGEDGQEPTTTVGCGRVSRVAAGDAEAVALEALRRETGIEHGRLVLARGDAERWPDLAAAMTDVGRAAPWRAGVVLVDGACPVQGATVEAAVERYYLDTATVGVYGGPTAIPDCDQGLSQVGALTGRYRVGGGDRCETVAQAAARAAELAEPIEAVVVRADDPADAAIALPTLGRRPNRVLLLSQRDAPCPATVRFLREHVDITTLRVIGGTAAVADSAVERLRAEVGRPLDVHRHAGPDRYATAAEVAADLFGDADRVVVFAGDQAHAALLARRVTSLDNRDRPLLFVEHDRVPPPVATYLAGAAVSRILVVGPTRVVAPEVRRDLLGALASMPPDRLPTPEVDR